MLNGYVLCFEPASLFGGNDRPYRLLHDLGQFSATTKDRATFQIAGSTYQILRAEGKKVRISAGLEIAGLHHCHDC